MKPAEFEKLARQVLGATFGTELLPAKRNGFPKAFDLVSADGKIVGDAKYYKLVQGLRLPPVKWSVIAEHVWFLEKIEAQTKFLVFGNDRRVAIEWLKRWGCFVPNGFMFFFLSDSGHLKRLHPGQL